MLITPIWIQPTIGGVIFGSLPERRITATYLCGRTAVAALKVRTGIGERKAGALASSAMASLGGSAGIPHEKPLMPLTSRPLRICLVSLPALADDLPFDQISLLPEDWDELDDGEVEIPDLRRDAMAEETA
jgi:hypothetical protein